MKNAHNSDFHFLYVNRQFLQVLNVNLLTSIRGVATLLSCPYLTSPSPLQTSLYQQKERDGNSNINRDHVLLVVLVVMIQVTEEAKKIFLK